ncbi:rolling circle replication-associated protein, partial [Clostridium perfringens]
MKVLKNQPLVEINSKKKIKLTDMGNIKEIMYLQKSTMQPFGIKKISKNEYMVVATGEILEYKNRSENRSQDKESLRKTFKKLRELINTNFVGNRNELCFTITYKENVRDPKVLYKDFDKFMKKLKYRYGSVDYINVVEPQERGAWHCHILLRFNDLKKAYIPNKEISEMWGKGFVKVKAMKKDIDNLGAYLSAYLGDIEITDSNVTQLVQDGAIKVGQSISIKEIEIEGKKKKFIKGGRLHYYPTGMNIYRASRGIKQPIVSHISYEDAKKIVGAATPTYSTCTLIQDDN